MFQIKFKNILLLNLKRFKLLDLDSITTLLRSIRLTKTSISNIFLKLSKFSKQTRTVTVLFVLTHLSTQFFYFKHFLFVRKIFSNTLNINLFNFQMIWDSSHSAIWGSSNLQHWKAITGIISSAHPPSFEKLHFFIP